MLLPLIFGATAFLLSYCYTKLRYQRFNQYAHFPQMPTTLILGHLKTMDSFIRGAKPNGHPDLAFQAINEALGRPPLMLVDLRPFGPAMVIVRSHEIAEQVSKASKQLPYSLPKIPQVYGHIVHVTGPTSILGADGEEWKELRKRFNAGFAPQHIITFLPRILDKSFTFLDNLDHFAKTGRCFSLANLTENLTFDIITSVTMHIDFGAQKMDERNEFTNAYHELFETYASEQMDLPWFFTPHKEWKRRQLSKRVRKTLTSIVQDAHINRKHGNTKSRSILSLSLDDNANAMTRRAIDEACDQLSTFLFAGHDTTSILLSWLFYELSRTPHAMQALRNELDSLFGPDANPTVVRDRLLSDNGQDLLNHMAYTAAVIKETLRLWPPAGTARLTKPGAGIKVQTSIGEYNLEGVSVYNCTSMIQRDPEVYGDTANDFVPERWLQTENSTGTKQIPPSAWRPFERGPRNCIGQELANLEARVVVALVARRYDFVKVGLGEVAVDEAGNPISDENGRYKVTSEMYPVSLCDWPRLSDWSNMHHCRLEKSHLSQLMGW
ncbi:cytochrome P450 [Xylaria sp. FL1042]|nr:cytochrome P450 [Xylaria sp. FL1042]